MSDVRARPAGSTVTQGGRAKAYRPLPEAERIAAFRAGIAAYERGDHFLAHELLEPAWMGTDDPAERDLYQGLIKVAAAFVHGARGNAAGVAANLRGARERLERVPVREADRRGIALLALLDQIEERLVVAEGLAVGELDPAAGSARGTGRRTRRPVPISAPLLRGAVG